MGDIQGRITGFWSMVAAGYEEHPGNVPAHGSDEYERWVAAVRDALPASPADVLDLATGTGFLAVIAAALGHRVTGIDLSGEMLEEARRTARDRALPVRLEEGDAVDPPFPPESFDVVTSRHLLWTLREPDTAIANWRRLVRAVGSVVAFDGFWFEQDPPGPAAGDAEEPGPFERYYTAETRAALPFMGIDRRDPVVETFERAGFSRVVATDLPALRNEAAGGVVPFVVIARP